jgi:hypothetical protein
MVSVVKTKNSGGLSERSLRSFPTETLRKNTAPLQSKPDIRKGIAERQNLM